MAGVLNPEHRANIVDRYKHDAQGRQLIESIFNFFLKQEEVDEGFLALGDDGITYFYCGREHHLYEIGHPRNPGLDFLAYLVEWYGLLNSDPISRRILDKVDSYCRIHGKRPRVKRFAWFDTIEEILYLSRYDGTCYKLDGDSISIVPNGESVLFVDDDQGKFCEADIGPHGLLLPNTITDLQYNEDSVSRESQEALFTIWLHLTPFGTLLPGPPILLIEGEKGSGKTTAAKRAQLVAQGNVNNQRLTAKREDFLVTITKMPIALLDNVDSYVSWLPDAIAGYCTGSGDTKRQLYTDSAQVKIEPTSFPVITTRNPKSFRRDDVADRCMVLRLDRREGKAGYESEIELQQFLIKNRPKLYGEWLYNLNRIIAIRKTIEYPSEVKQYRLIDMVRFGYVVAEALGWPKEKVTKTFQEFRREQEELSLNYNDTFVVLLESWLEDPNNAATGGPISAKDLYRQLDTQANYLGLRSLPFTSPRGLSNKLRDNGGGLSRFFDIKKLGTAHGKRVLYSIKKK